MTIKRTTAFLLSICLLCGLCSAFAAAGTAQDPLISRSYADGSYPSIVFAEPFQQLRDSAAILEYKLSQAKGQTTAGANQLSVASGGFLKASPGSSFTLLSGGASVSGLSGTLINVTTGRTVSRGASLTVGHSYVAAENAIATISASSASRFSAMGDVSASSGQVSFSDVTSDMWFYDSVSYAAGRGLINGKGGGIFDPQGDLTIGETIKLAACIHQLYHEKSITLVNGDPWYMSYVQYALDKGIISRGYSNYDARATRAEFVNIFYSALPSSEYVAINVIGGTAIPDVSTNHPYYSRIIAFYRAGILTGMDSQGTFEPDSNILRCEVATFVERMLESSARKTFTLR